MAEEFNQAVKDMFRIFKDLPSSFRGKLHINELQSKMISGMRTEPEYAIKVLGVFVWLARTEISSRDAYFFLNRRYEMDLTRICKEHNIFYDDAINTVNFMKDAYKSAPSDVQNRVLDQMNILLKIIAVRELAKRSS